MLQTCSLVQRLEVMAHGHCRFLGMPTLATPMQWQMLLPMGPTVCFCSYAAAAPSPLTACGIMCISNHSLALMQSHTHLQSCRSLLHLAACSNNAHALSLEPVKLMSLQGRGKWCCFCRPGDISGQCRLSVHQSSLQRHVYCSGSSIFSCKPRTSHSNLPQGLCQHVCRLLTWEWLCCSWLLAQRFLKAIVLLLKLHLESGDTINQPNADTLEKILHDH